MSLRVRRIKKAFGFDETKTQKYVLVPDRATVVNFEHLCEQVSEVAGVNMGMVQITLYGLVKSMKTFIRQGHAVCGGLPAECGRIDGDLTGFVAERLLKGHLDLAGGIRQHKGGAEFKGFTRRDIRKLTVDHRVVGVAVRKDGGDSQFCAVLYRCFRDGPYIGAAVLAVVGKIQGQNEEILPVRCFQDLRVLVAQLIGPHRKQAMIFRRLRWRIF